MGSEGMFEQPLRRRELLRGGAGFEPACKSWVFSGRGPHAAARIARLGAESVEFGRDAAEALEQLPLVTRPQPRGRCGNPRSSAPPADRCRGGSRRAHAELDRASDKLVRLIAGGQPRRWRSQRLHAVDGHVGPGMPQGHGLNYFRLWIQFWMGRPRREGPVRYCARPWLDWPVGLGGKASCIRRNGASPRLGEIFSSDLVAQRSRSPASPASLPPAAAPHLPTAAAQVAAGRPARAAFRSPVRITP